MYKLNYFNFKEKDNNFLITNDIGKYCFLSKEDFSNLTKKKEIKIENKKELLEKGFIYEVNDEIFSCNQAMQLRKSKEYLLAPTTLHIFVVTKNCNFSCIYCQAGNLNQSHNYNMTRETAKKAVDIALESPSKYLTFEFQGGEPLINYETVKQIKKLKDRNIKVNAIQTTTKHSLDCYKEIVDEYIELGMDSIFIRPLTRLGKADNNWKNIGYNADEFVKFYKEILDYIIEKNKSGIFLSEGHCNIILKKILFNDPVNYMELRSPCGGAIGQLAYCYDGDIYTCDEGRMLSEMGNSSFRLGNVNENTYEDLMQCDCTKAMCISSCVECLPYCSSCVYMPYCGTCPVVNLAQDNNIFAKNPREYRCKVYSGIMDILFDYIENKPDVAEILKTWIE